MKLSLFFLFSLFFSNFSLAESNSSTTLFNKALELELHNKPQWLRLIHFNENKQRSNIISEDFFLSQVNLETKQPSLPLSELEATITAFFSDIPSQVEITNQHPICRFPARFLWLTQSLALKPNIALDNCTGMLEWSNWEELSSVSVLLVSGYLGNPASTFGHVLLKLNTLEGEKSRGLLDTAINFGAAVPEGENSFSYILNGLFGGYNAGFRENYYYSDDLVYANSDQRDMWDYKLELNKTQRALLVAHIWELFDKKYEYYFLKQNCAYRIAELLELAFDQNILKTSPFGYAPVNLFNALEVASLESSETSDLLIDSITFQPSPERILYENYNALSYSNKHKVKLFLTKSSTLKEILESDQDILSGNIEEWSALLNFLLKYNTFKTSYINEEDTIQLEYERNILLQARLRQPALTREEALIDFPSIASPAKGSAPARINIKTNYASQHNAVEISFSPFYYDVLGQHAQQGSELIVFNTTLSWNELDDEIAIKEINLIQVQKVDFLTPKVFKKVNLSWRLAANLINSYSNCRSCLRFQITGGLGQSLFSNNNSSGIAMLDFSFSDNAEKYKLRPHLDYLYSKGNNAFSLNFGYNYSLDTYKGKANVEIEYRYRLEKNIEFSLGYTSAKLHTLNTFGINSNYFEDSVTSAAISFYY